jgi:bacteriorhodopsin
MDLSMMRRQEGGGGGGGDGGGGASGPAPKLFGEQEILEAVTWGSGAWNPFQSPAVLVADWLGFIVLGGSAVFLYLIITNFHGPRGDEKYFAGYREEKMMSIYVNSFAAYVYWARCGSHANGDVGPVAYIHLLKYVDYLFTCPLLSADLLCTLNLPFKVTYPYFVWLTIGTGVGCTKFVGPARYMWFCFGCALFCVAWYSVYVVVVSRLRQIAGSKMTQKCSMTIQVAAAIYFSIWIAFPILWILLELGAINHPISLSMHAVLDVVAKSIYGFILLSFQITCEKEEFVFLPLMPRVEKNDDEISDVGDADVEVGYHFDETGLHANHTPMGPVVGSSKQRRISREMQMEAARQKGLASPYGGMAPPAANGADEQAILRQIQALNVQLNDMVPGSGSNRRV